MVYGTNIQLLGEFFDKLSSKMEPEIFLNNIQNYMDRLRSIKSKTSNKVKVGPTVMLSSASKY